MALILLRARAKVPVVICGEAGCGKTSLIAYLALIVEVQFQALNLHAGIDEITIITFMNDALKKAEKGEIWLFFDEINTCNHLGLFADLISRRMLNGKLIHPNIRLFSACNPYRLRKRAQIEAGLTNKINNHERSNLVYQVKPLPDQILEYVWDYGILKPEVEYKHIQIMVEKELLSHPVFVELLFASQKFIRKVEGPDSVSLRDVKRAIILVKFFYRSLVNRPACRKGHIYPPPGTPKTVIRSYVLALGLCYHSRLYEQDLRKQYRREMGQILQSNQVYLGEHMFALIIREEQEDYINRMECPPNIAINEALLENVLVMIVCILTRIPLFLIGAPGSSKSLAIQLISSNLRGSDSNDSYFRNLPQVYLFPYQGSSVSTPDSIIKVFDKANKYQKTNSALFPVTSVVLLNVGLAETSSFNPLNALHSFLEPSYPATGPTVSVIGISNWRLDISKSSRALLVQRPQFDLVNLVNTAERLLYKKVILPGQRGTLEPLAKAYLDYEKHGQAFPNFHGLRDYYALVKRLSLVGMTPENIQMALARNFGGTESNAKLFEDCPYKPIPIEQLIDSNLGDPDARHLMVIGKRDSIISLLTYRLRRRNLEPVVILGSQFSGDQEDYSYNVLSRIMMCIETGRTLILTDLEMIYGSLSDLWDQNYIVVKNNGNAKYYTRIALGAYANPMICVSPSFKCIIVMDEKNLTSAGPPFLNQFEKQKMSINATLTDRQKLLVNKLEVWTRKMSTLSEANSVTQLCNRFTQKDLFIGFDDEETLQSLVINITKNNLEVEDEILEKCKECLIAIATSDGIIRAELSNLELNEVDRWKNVYFNQQHHDSLYNYFSALLNREQSLTDSKGHLVIVNTFSKVNTDIKSCLQDFLRCQVHNLSIFRTEAQFSNIVKYFFFESTDQVLILQCDATAINAKCINLAKHIIEEFRNEFLVKKEQLGTNVPMKHACIILHIQRDCKSNLISSNFICGWKRIVIESLESPEIPLIKFLDQPLYDIVDSGLFVNSFEKILQCCLSYIEDENHKNHISALNRKVLNNSNFVQCIKAKTFEWISESCKNWQYEVALSKKNLSKFTCFSLALQDYVKLITEQTIAKILYSFENLSEISTFFNNNIKNSEMKKELYDLWKQFFMDNTVNNVDNLPESRPIITSPMINNDLEFPFSFYFQINYYKNYYYEELDILKQNSENINHYNKLVEDHIEDFRDNLISINQNIENLQKYSELYYYDFIRIILSTYSIKLTSKEKLDFILKYLTGDKIIVNDPFILHIYWWKCAKEILVQLKLVETFPNIIAKAQNDFIVYGKLDQYLFRESINLILQNICDDKPWKQDMNIILTINDKINDSKIFSNLQLLFTCNDLLKINSVSLEKIREIISLGKSVKKQEFITAEIINLVFVSLDNNNDIIPIRSFIARSLKLISLESEERLILYRNLFSRNPFELVGSIIEKIFSTEVQQNKQIFFTLIKNSKDALQTSIRLNTVNGSIKSIDSDMAELCCEIIQRIFNRFESSELLPYFRHSIELFVKPGGLPLQQITSIALLKEIIHKFWKNFVQGDKSLSKLVLKEINDNQSIQSYFALYLYQRSSMEQFEMFKKEFPWLENFTDVEVNYLSKLLKPTRKVNFEDFHTFYNSNLQNLDKYPFLLVFFKHYERLKHIKYFYPIVRFVKILGLKLEYYLTRKAAQIMTFHEFIKKESADEDEYANLKSIFEEFAFGWNSIINYIELKELSLNKPLMNLELPVIFGLIEQNDAGVYLCAILEFLIKLHNEFLDSVIAIPVGTCDSLKFLEELFWNNLTPKTYFIASKKVSQAQHVNFISYEWNDKILNYGQRDLEIKEDTNFIFDLQKIESKLTKKLVFNKVYFEMEDNQSYLKKFSFKHELFHNFPRTLSNIKKALPQKPIPADKMLITLAMFQPSLILKNSINLSELIILFEMILCFIKELPIKNSNILISDFVNQWLKLARYNITFIDILKEFSLQHTVALYELIEEQIANSIIHNIDDKFKVPLTQQMKDSINNVVDYYDLEYQNQQLISAKAFALALKRFIYRFLLIDSNIENLSLNLYLLDFTLDLWTSDVKIKKLFPTCLLVSHAYNSYIFIVGKIEKATNEKQINNNFPTTTARKTLIKKISTRNKYD